MKYFLKPSYIRSVRKLGAARAGKAQAAFEQLVLLLEKGEITPGLGVKQLRHGLWEIRAGLLDRIVFRRAGANVEMILAGTHDEIRRFLKNC